MAIRLGRRNVKDTETFEDHAIGLALPIQITNVAFDQTFKTNDQVRFNIINLLLTRKGERVMQPDFGTGLHELLFETIDEDLEERLEDTITEAFERWLPYVTLETVEIDISNELRDQNKANMTIFFRIGDNVSLESVTFTIEG